MVYGLAFGRAVAYLRAPPAGKRRQRRVDQRRRATSGGDALRHSAPRRRLRASALLRLAASARGVGRHLGKSLVCPRSAYGASRTVRSCKPRQHGRRRRRWNRRVHGRFIGDHRVDFGRVEEYDTTAMDQRPRMVLASSLSREPHGGGAVVVFAHLAHHTAAVVEAEGRFSDKKKVITGRIAITTLCDRPPATNAFGHLRT